MTGDSATHRVLLGVTGGIAAYKTVELVRLMTRAAAEPVEPSGDDFGGDALSERVWRAVRELPARQRDITELVFCREMTVDEASTVMGVTVGTGRVHYDRAKKALASRLEDLRDEGSER